MRQRSTLTILSFLFLQAIFSQSFTASGADIVWQLRPSVIDEAGNLDDSGFIMDYVVHDQALIVLISTSPVAYHLSSYDLASGNLNWLELIALEEEEIIFADLDIVEDKIIVTGNAVFAWPSLSTLGMYTNKVFNPNDGQLLSAFSTTFQENPGLFVEGLLVFNYESLTKFNFLRSALTGDVYTWTVLEFDDGVVDTLLQYATTDFNFPDDLGLYRFEDGNNVLLTHDLQDPNAFGATSTKGIYFDDSAVVSDTLELSLPTGYLQFPSSTLINDKVFVLGNRGFVDTVSYDGRISVYNSTGEILFSEIITKDGAPFNISGMTGDPQERYFILSRETNSNLYTEGLFMNTWNIGDVTLEEAYSINTSIPFATYSTGNRLYTNGQSNVHIIRLKEYENEDSNFLGDDPIREGDEIVVTMPSTTSTAPTLASSSVKVFPNPTTGICQISGLSLGTSLDVYDIYGIRHLTTRVDSRNELDLTGLQNGIYFLHSQQANAITVKRVMIQH
ncbi:MAG: T9SS type A sorting domain-containing protein [Bacteroidota bacterium]